MSLLIHNTNHVNKTMKTIPFLFLAAAAVFATASTVALADLSWPSDMEEQLAALHAAVIPSGDNAAAGITGAFQTFAIDEAFSDGINFSTMPPGTMLILR